MDMGAILDPTQYVIESARLVPGEGGSGPVARIQYRLKKPKASPWTGVAEFLPERQWVLRHHSFATTASIAGRPHKQKCSVSAQVAQRVG